LAFMAVMISALILSNKGDALMMPPKRIKGSQIKRARLQKGNGLVSTQTINLG
jgi:hypothetical protein